MNGVKGSSQLATCSGCGETTPVWKLKNGEKLRNRTFDPATLTFQHGSRKCRPDNGPFDVVCSDGRSLDCRSRWAVTHRSELEKIESFKWTGKTKARAVCGSCSRLRTNQTKGTNRQKGHLRWALKYAGKGDRLDATALLERAEQVDKEAAAEIQRTRRVVRDKTLGRATAQERREWGLRGGHTKKPGTSITRLIRRSQWQSFELCHLDGLLIERSLAARWAGRFFHLSCFSIWRRYCKQRADTPLRHQRLPPPPETRRGLPISLATLSAGYRSIVYRLVRRKSFRAVAARLGTTADNVLERERQFLRRAPGHWGAAFPGLKANRVLQALCPLPEKLRDRTTDAVRGRAVVRLLKVGMAPADVAAHVGWVPDEVEAVVRRVSEVGEDRQSLENDPWRPAPCKPSMRRRPSSGERRIYYQGRRAASLCADCRAPALPGLSRCKQHLEESRARMTKHRGPVACLRCGKDIPEADRQHGRRYHPACFEEKERERRATPKIRARSKRLAREYSERHRKLGLCLKCSAKAAPGKVLCERHGYKKATDQDVVESR